MTKIDNLLSALTAAQLLELASAIKKNVANQAPMVRQLEPTQRLEPKEPPKKTHDQELDELFANAFDKGESFVNASHDRQMMRLFLDTQARNGTSEVNKMFAWLHKWWDGTAYSLHNDWLFTDNMMLEIALRNADGKEKTFKLKIAL